MGEEISAYQPAGQDYEFYGPQKPWYQLWWRVWTRPSPKTFKDILNDPGAGAATGLIWAAASSITLTAVILLIGYISGKQSGFVPLLALMTKPLRAMFGLAIFAGLFHFLAKLFGGQGNVNELIYCYGAVAAPLTLLRIFFVLLGLFTPMVTSFQIPIWPISFSLSSFPTWVWISIAFQMIPYLYALVPSISALAAVEKFGIVRSTATHLIPAVLLGVCGMLLSLMSKAR